MQLEELNLPEIDIHSPEFIKDPNANYAEARRHSWLAKYPFGYILLDYQAMKDFLPDERCRTPNRDITALAGVEKGSPFERFNDHFLLALDGDEHRRHRRIMAPAFTPREANRFRPFMRETINEILDQVADKGECDFVRVAAQYPITVMCHLIGVSPKDIARFEEWVIVQSDAFSLNQESVASVNAALGHMFEYVTELVEHRRKPGEKRDDLLQTLVDLATEGERLSDEELRVLLIHLIAGGYDTTKNQLICIMKILLDHPEEWKALSRVPDRIKPFIEEALRFLNPITTTFRVPNVDIEYRDTLIPKDTMLMLPLTFAGRDEAVNESPMNFNPDRPTKRHLAFGLGIHICVGMFLARALLEEALPIIVERLKQPKAAGEAIPRQFSAIGGYVELPIRFESEQREP